MEIQAYLDAKEVTLTGANIPNPILNFDEATFPGKDKKNGAFQVTWNYKVWMVVGKCFYNVISFYMGKMLKQYSDPTGKSLAF